MQKEILKRLSELENKIGGNDLIFKIEDENGRSKRVTFRELMIMQEEPHYLDDGNMYHTGFPPFRVCGGNNSKQIGELLDKIEADIKTMLKEVKLQ